MNQKKLRLPEDLNELVASPFLRPEPLDLTVACYTFPHYHNSALNDRLYGNGWTEFRVAEGASPWFPGHRQPRRPLLGELNEREPETWTRYNNLARQVGIDVWIWDWYWYNDGPVLHEALEEGFLRTGNSSQMKFAVMWTNHPWGLVFPDLRTDGTQAFQPACHAPDSMEDIWRSMSYLMARYFHWPNYWRIAGRPVLAIWDLPRLINLFGTATVRQLFNDLRAYSHRLGHSGVHIHITGPGCLLGRQLEEVGADSFGRYNSIAPGGLELAESESPDYGRCAAEAVRTLWPRDTASAKLTYFPSVSPGWDTTPRRLKPPVPRMIIEGDLPFPDLVVGETPAAFGAFVEAALGYLRQHRPQPAVMTIGCWNEWTEGQYLLPDTDFGYGMIQALGNAIARQRGG